MAAKKKTTTKKPAQKDLLEDVLEQPEEHRVFSHIMYILFLFAAALAAYYTFTMLFEPELQGVAYMPVKALVLLGWAFVFKTLAHRIHPPHY
ncbi:MAG: hypothetical protein ACMXYD_02610 [Candidatus Woesearchaeota archaeon]